MGTKEFALVTKYLDSLQRSRSFSLKQTNEGGMGNLKKTMQCLFYFKMKKRTNILKRQNNLFKTVELTYPV